MMGSALTNLQRKNEYVADSEPPEWQRIGDEIKAAMIFTRAQFWSAAVLCRSSAFASIAKCYCLRLKNNR
jgi:hypothetical protein